MFVKGAEQSPVFLRREPPVQLHIKAETSTNFWSEVSEELGAFATLVSNESWLPHWFGVEQNLKFLSLSPSLSLDLGSSFKNYAYGPSSYAKLPQVLPQSGTC